jgi:hypothetical protein
MLKIEDRRMEIVKRKIGREKPQRTQRGRAATKVGKRGVTAEAQSAQRFLV